MQKSVNKDVHLVVEFLESGEYHYHALHEKGINPLVSKILDDVFLGSTTSLGGFIVLDFP